jgi:hypothetical protein
MHTRTVLVSVTAVTEEHHFATLDRHGRDTNETLHYLQLLLDTRLSIISFEFTILMMHALIHNSTVLHTLHLLLKCLECLKIKLQHHRFGGNENTDMAERASFIFKPAAKPGDCLTKRLFFATTVKRIPCPLSIFYGRAAMLHSMTELEGDDELIFSELQMECR